MAFQRHPAVAGTVGTLTINDYDYPATTWGYDTQLSSSIVTTASSMPFSDIRRGGRLLTITASGIVRNDFNPFRLANAPYLGTYAKIVCIALNNNTFATCPSALITHWNYQDASDGVASWSLVAQGNFEFQNMGGLNNR